MVVPAPASPGIAPPCQPAPLASPNSSSDARRALALFLLFAGFYLLTASGHFYAVDEERLYGMTESLVERRTLALPEGAWHIPAERPSGPFYAEYMPGQPIIAVPLYLLGRAVAPLFPPDAHGYVTRFFVALLNPLVTAATVALLYQLARVLGYRVGSAVALAAIYGLATNAWPHGRTFFAEPLTAGFVLLAFYGLCRATVRRARRPGWGWLIGSGLALVAAVGVKPHAALAAPFFGVYLIGRTAFARRPDEPWLDLARRLVAAVLGWSAGVALAALPLAGYNLVRYGGVFQTGYGPRPFNLIDPAHFPFFAPEGLYGLVLSSGKGFLWYSPPAILALGGWWLFFRRWRAEALVCLAIVLSNVWFYSRFSYWHGDGSWGPRFLAIALPFTILPLAAVLERWPASRLARLLVTVVVAAGLAVQLLGVLVNFDWYLLRSDEQTRHVVPAASPLLAHPRILAQRAGEWYRRLRPARDTAVLTGGFSYAGDRAGEPPLPRWTTGAGQIALYPATLEALQVRLTFVDARPPALAGPPPVVLVNGQPLPGDAVIRGRADAVWFYQFTVPPELLVRRAATVTLQSSTWNPKTAGLGSRDEEIGVQVQRVDVWQGAAARLWPVREELALAIEPLPRTPRWRFWWFNDDTLRHHLVDHWAWYAAVAGFSRRTATVWIGAYGTVGLTFLLAGALLLRSSRSRRARAALPG